MKGYLLCIFEENQTDTVSGESKSLLYDILLAELFYPNNNTNKSTDSVVLDLSFEAVMSLLSDLRYETKATAEYL